MPQPLGSSEIPPEAITGLVLAGGQGLRMGGQDKGLIDWQGRPLAAHALARLAPQVGPLLISANRHLDDYRAIGTPFAAAVCTDTLQGFQGPLAGILGGLLQAHTPYVAVVPCDNPRIPEDLVTHLTRGMQHSGTSAALAVSDGRRQPTMCVLRTSLAPALERYLSAGHRKLDVWFAELPAAEVSFTDARGFRNLNTPHDLEQARA